MASIFVQPLPFTAASTSQAPYAGSVANLNSDIPGMAWLGTLPTPYIIIDLGASATGYDTVAISANNLRSTDTVKISTGTTNTGTGSYAGTAVAAWSGMKGAGTADTIIRLGATRTERYIRIDFTATSHPDGFVQAGRIIVGAAMSTIGIDTNCQMLVTDRSVFTSGPGYRSVDEYDVITGWKFSTGWISESDWRTKFQPFLVWAGQRRCFLFIPDDSTPTNWQTDAIFGYFSAAASGTLEAFNAWRIESTIMQLTA